MNIISHQATINIGTIGHVAHGKSTVVKALSGVHTVRFKTEQERNITIKLGYANAKIYESEDPTRPCYAAKGSSHPDRWCNDEGIWMKLVRHVSFVDCPGHDIFMATMLSGATVMDAAFLLIAGNESCPQPQTSEHLAAAEIMKLKHLLILQNKLDVVKEKDAIAQYQDIKEFVKGTVAEDAPVIPISAQLGINISAICEHIVKTIPLPRRNTESPARLIIIRSFDINKPGGNDDDLQGGVVGGSILCGILRVGQEIEIRPGIITRDSGGLLESCTPIRSRVLSLYAENNSLESAVPGGLIGVGTQIDPSLAGANRLVGQVLGELGSLPPVFTALETSFVLLRRLVGVKEGGKVNKITKAELLLITIGATSVGGKVVAVKDNLAKIELLLPVCADEGDKVALSRRIDKHWRLIGWGIIQKGLIILN